jgi:O-Antigen ligase
MLDPHMIGPSGNGLPEAGRVRLPWPGQLFDPEQSGALALAAAILASLLIAALLQVSLAAALGLVVLIVAGAFVARRGVMGVALLLAGALPWLVVFSAVEPKLAETFAAGTMVVVLLVVAAPRDDGSRALARLRLGMILFYLPVVIGLARAPHGAQIIEALKYIVFPFTVYAVIAGTNDSALQQLSRVAFTSGAIAITFNLLAGLGGLNHSYYAAGDIQGLGGQHDLALLAGAITAASLARGTSLKWASMSAIGAIATLATGVRSTLPGLLLALVAKMFRAGARARGFVMVAVVTAAVLVSGVGNVLVQRFHHDQSLGEFSSFDALGSGRGGIYTTAIHGWWVSSPLNWAYGTGLRSVERIEERATGNDVVGQSDVIQAGVELGLIGLIGLVLIWWTLIARARSKLPLLVLLPFAVFNGSLEYGAPLVVTLLLTVNPTGDAEEPAGELIPRPPLPAAPDG